MAKINRFDEFDHNKNEKKNEGNRQAVALNDFIFIRFAAKQPNPAVTNMFRTFAADGGGKAMLLVAGVNNLAITEFKTTLSKEEVEAKFNSIPNIKFVIIDRNAEEGIASQPVTGQPGATGRDAILNKLKSDVQKKKRLLKAAVDAENYAEATKQRDEIAELDKKIADIVTPPAEGGAATPNESEHH